MFIIFLGLIVVHLYSLSPTSGVRQGIGVLLKEAAFIEKDKEINTEKLDEGDLEPSFLEEMKRELSTQLDCLKVKGDKLFDQLLEEWQKPDTDEVLRKDLSRQIDDITDQRHNIGALLELISKGIYPTDQKSTEEVKEFQISLTPFEASELRLKTTSFLLHICEKEYEQTVNLISFVETSQDKRYFNLDLFRKLSEVMKDKSRILRELVEEYNKSSECDESVIGALYWDLGLLDSNKSKLLDQLSEEYPSFIINELSTDLRLKVHNTLGQIGVRSKRVVNELEGIAKSYSSENKLLSLNDRKLPEPQESLSMFQARSTLKTVKEKIKNQDQAYLDKKKKSELTLYTVEQLLLRKSVQNFQSQLQVNIVYQDGVVSQSNLAKTGDYNVVATNTIDELEGGGYQVNIIIDESILDMAILANLSPVEYELFIDFILLNELIQATYSIDQKDIHRQRMLPLDILKLEFGSQISALLTVSKLHSLDAVKLVHTVIGKIILAGQDYYYDVDSSSTQDSSLEEAGLAQEEEKVAKTIERMNWDQVLKMIEKLGQEVCSKESVLSYKSLEQEISSKGLDSDFTSYSQNSRTLLSAA